MPDTRLNLKTLWISGRRRGGDGRLRHPDLIRTSSDVAAARWAGEAVNAQVDWNNVAEEVESVGRSQLAAVRSLLMQALAHMLKAEAWPLSQEVPHWQAKARGFRIDAADIFTPNMRQRIKVAEI